MWVILQNNAGWDCFKTLISPEILKIRNPLLEEHCAFLGSHTFVPISWMQETNFIFAQFNRIRNHFFGRRSKVGRYTPLDLWDLIVAVLHGNTNQHRIERGDPLLNKREACSPPHTIHKCQQCQRMINKLDNVDFILSNVQSSHQEALLYVFEDNEAVIKMIIKGRGPAMRHVSRTHRVALDWLFDRINLDSKIQIKYIDTKNQLADILTKGNFTRDEWNHLLCLFCKEYISHTGKFYAIWLRRKRQQQHER